MKMPYEEFEFKPGDLIAAERLNAMQDAIRNDTQEKIKTANEEIKKTGVDRASNSEKFDTKTSKEWTDALDQRYSPKVHDHEGKAAYKCYFKHIEAGPRQIVLKHELGRFPLVDMYELEDISVKSVETHKIINVKFYLYYHHEERDKDSLNITDISGVRWPLGIPFEQLLKEYDVKWEDDDSLGDVINDFFEEFFKPPTADHMEHAISEWIDNHKEKTIAYLKKRDEWPDIRWVVQPKKMINGLEGSTPEINAMAAQIVAAKRPTIPVQISVGHLSYDTLALKVLPIATIPATSDVSIDLMILLRS
jgi:hypothetical protein